MASHAGTTPMDRRRDAAAAVAELVLFVERRAARDGDSSAPSACCRCRTARSTWCPGAASSASTCARRPTPQRDALVSRRAGAAQARSAIARGVRFTLEETMRAAAAPSAPEWQRRWERAVDTLGVPLHRMPSGAGHDAMKLHEVMPQAMLFVRGRTPASATTRSSRAPTTTSSSRCAPSPTCSTTSPRSSGDERRRRIDAWVDPTDERPAGRAVGLCRRWIIGGHASSRTGDVPSACDPNLGRARLRPLVAAPVGGTPGPLCDARPARVGAALPRGDRLGVLVSAERGVRARAGSRAPRHRGGAAADSPAPDREPRAADADGARAGRAHPRPRLVPRPGGRRSRSSIRRSAT